MKRTLSIFKGFTLVELVMTIVILMVIAGIVIPLYHNIQKYAKEAAVKGALGQMRAAIQGYSAREIAAGRANRDATGTAGGWPTLAQVNDRKYESTSLAHVLDPDRDVPENPYAKTVYGRDADRVVEPPGGGAKGSDVFTSALPEEGAAYAEGIEPMIIDDSCCGGGGGPPPRTPGGWNYNPTTGVFWARTNVEGEGSF